MPENMYEDICVSCGHEIRGEPYDWTDSGPVCCSRCKKEQQDATIVGEEFISPLSLAGELG